MNTQEFCEYVSKQPTNVDPEVSIAYFKGLETTTEIPEIPIQYWAKRFAQEHLTDMFAFDSLGTVDDGWIIWVTPASDHIYVIKRSKGRETLALVKRGGE